jgi:hypothetical protein
MNFVTLAVLAQVASTPLVPSPTTAAPAQADSAVSPPTTLAQVRSPPPAWSVIVPVVTGLNLGLAGAEVAWQATPYTWRTSALAGSMVVGGLIGTSVGVGLGLLAGHFADRGSTVGKVASVALMVLSAVGCGASGWNFVTHAFLFQPN